MNDIDNIKYYLLFEGSQEKCHGAVSISKAYAVFSKLQKRKEPGIDFNEKTLVTNLKGGTCTAMALHFLNDYFALIKFLYSQFPYLDTKRLLCHLIEDFGEKFKESSENMRTLQSAYNTIEVRDVGVDFSKNKIQSLLNYYKFKIDFYSDKINIKKSNKNGYEYLENVVGVLPKGTYIVRTWKPSDNIKLEEDGHSTIYIKHKNSELYYDPSEGLSYYQKTENYFPALYKAFKRNFIIHRHERARIYRVRPKKSIKEQGAQFLQTRLAIPAFRNYFTWDQNLQEPSEQQHLNS